MVCDQGIKWCNVRENEVLILILLEYGLRLQKVEKNASIAYQVLILILLEYGLRLLTLKEQGIHWVVLILILLEYGLRPSFLITIQSWQQRLNPYSIGIWSATVRRTTARLGLTSVLILILLEYGLRRNSMSFLSLREQS